MNDAIAADYDSDCQACGACCSFSAHWPRFSLETDAEIDAIPERFVADDESGMRCDGSRCSALLGEVGKATACSVYQIRPQVCRACIPGGDDCRIARQRFGMSALNY
jgi:Fe-S-cluster containining protein